MQIINKNVLKVSQCWHKLKIIFIQKSINAMSLFQTLNQSPDHLHNFYSSRSRPPHPGSYEQYFQAKIQSSKVQRQKQTPASLKQNKIKSKSKLSKVRSSKVQKSPLKPKKTIQDYKIDPMYESRISQMLSEISIPVEEQKITKKQLRNLENKIMSEVLNLREQKIFALEDLNKIVDKKNKALELLKGYEVLKQTQRLSMEEEQAQYSKHSKTNGLSYNPYQSPQSTKQRGNKISHKSSRPLELINSKIVNEVQQMQSALSQANKIKQQLMRPLIQHPLLIKNAQLKDELQHLKKQLESSHQNKSNFDNQIQFYKIENKKMIQQLQRHKAKLSSLQHKRFQTFFPKDKIKIDQMKKLIEVEKSLEKRKEELQQQLLNGTIIRRAQDQMLIEQLKEENRQLLLNCQRIQITKGMDLEDDGYSSMTVEELQDLVSKEMENKRVFEQLFYQFQQKVEDLERENENLKRRKTRVSHYY